MWWSFAPVLGLFAVPVPAFAAHPQCHLVLSTRPSSTAPPPGQSSYGTSSVSGSVTTSATSTPTPTPLVPFAYGSKPIRGVNLYVLFSIPGSAPCAWKYHLNLLFQWGLVCTRGTPAFYLSFGAHLNALHTSRG